MRDIFNVIETDDIKHDIDIGWAKARRNIVKLFKLANRPLTIDELVVGYYRSFKPHLTRRQITQMVGDMVRKPIYGVEKISRGTYQLKRNDND